MIILKKLLIMTACAASAVLMLTGCGKGNSSEKGDPEITAKTVLSQIDPTLMDGMACKGDELFDKNCMKNYGISDEDVIDGGILYNKSGDRPDEISVLKMDDSDAAHDALKQRLEQRRAIFDGYAPDEMVKFDRAVITDFKGYWILIISEEAQDLSNQVKAHFDGR